MAELVRRWRGPLGYVAMVLATLGAFVLIAAPAGTDVLAPAPPAASAFPANTLLHVLLALAAVIVLARLLGALFRHLRQPPVIGEVVAGLALGPSLLGAVAPQVQAFIFPAAVMPFLSALAQVGVIMFMFLVGLELDPAAIRKRFGQTLAIAHASMALPFVLGVALALPLYRFAPAGVGLPLFAMFIGVALAVTAFPVLARILTDRNLQATPLGVTALACAALGDATAWCLLAIVVAIARAEPGRGLLTVGLAVLYAGVMMGTVRPLVQAWIRRHDGQGLTRTRMAQAMIAVLLSALTTEAIGIHAIFGAFFLGALVPHDSRIARELRARVEDFVLILLLPAFFAFTGLRTKIGLLGSAEDWLLCGAIVAVATIGKFGGATLAGRLTGMRWREAATIGALMNTRGLMELIVLNVGLDLGVVSPTLFAMMVIMAVVTTIATVPILDWLRAAPQERSSGVPERNL
jgi:Kef-type K+ transport system membrane component KefB